MKIERQPVRVSTVIGENAGQSVLEGSVSLPVDAPEIGRLLLVRAHPVIMRYEVAEEQILIEGAVDLEALYASFHEVDGGEDTSAEVVLEERLEIGRWDRQLPFEFVLDIAGAEPGLPAKVAVSADRISYELQDDKRSVTVDLVLGFSGTVYRIDEHSLTTQATADYEVHREQRRIRLPLESVSVRGQERIQGFLAFGDACAPKGPVLTIRPSGANGSVFRRNGGDPFGPHLCGLIHRQ